MRRRGTKRGCYGVMAVFWGALPLPTSPVDPMVGWEAAVVSSRRPETLVVSYGTANAHANQIFTRLKILRLGCGNVDFRTFWSCHLGILRAVGVFKTGCSDVIFLR